jgi:hypothetical protein
MDAGGYDHAVCISGENFDRASCDETYENGGAYAIGVEFLMKVSQTQRFDSALRERARTMAEKALRERFNTSPVTKTIQISAAVKSRRIFR